MKIKTLLQFFFADKRHVKELFRIMRISFFLLFVCGFQLFAFDTEAQNAIIRIEAHTITISQLIREIENQTDYLVVYRNREVDTNQQVRIKNKRAQVSSYLNEAFSGTNVDYRFENDYIILTKKQTANGEKVSSKNHQSDRIVITGNVVDEYGEPVIGASVVEKGTTNGSITDIDGQFSLNVKENATLQISYIGYITQEISVKNQQKIAVTLAEDLLSLDEVVVVGYGVQNTRALATSISRVSAKEITSAVTASTVDQALQGRTTGVQVVETSGQPGASTVVRIRGNNSLKGDNEPLYVIDGFPMPKYQEATSGYTGGSELSGLYGINPNDIESIEILKDATASGIYGSRGANGVVLITTKSGVKGRSKIEFSSRTTMGSMSKPEDMMSGKEYAQIVNESYLLNNQKAPFDDINSLTTNTNWLDAITRNSVREDVSLSISGGGDKTSYYISGNYLYDRGILLNSDNNRATLRANVSSNVTNWYTVKFQLSLVRQTTNRAITNAHAWPSDGGSFLDGLRASPLVDVDYLGYNGKGIPGYSGYWFANPHNELDSKTDVLKNDNIMANIENWFKMTKDLQFVVNLGTNQNLSRLQIFFPETTNRGHSVNGSASNAMANTYSYNLNGFFTYDKTLNDDHSINATLGAEYNKQILERLNTSSSDFDIPEFGIHNIGSAKTQTIGSERLDRTILSSFLRLNYSYKGKYLMNSSFRVDGASPFAENKKYGVFPSVALAWNVSEEDFLKNVDAISMAKIRASYGVTGSQAIGEYSSLARYKSTLYQIGSSGSTVTAVYPESLANANLTWERTKQFNVGLDYSMFNQRLGVTFDYYVKTTDDLLQERTLPTQSGFSKIIDNYGSMRNRGFELSIRGDVINTRNFTYSTRFNISRNKTVLLNLGDKTTSDYQNLSGNLLGGVFGILTPGEKVGNFYGYKVIGLAQNSDFENGVPTYAYAGDVTNQIPGTWVYEDLNKDGVINDSDRQVLGNAFPDFTFGWVNDISWKRWGLSLFFTGSVGNDVLNLTRFYLNNGTLDYSGVAFSQTKDWYDNRWSQSNQHNNPKYPGTQKGLSVSDVNSVMIEDGSYLRLKTLSLFYSLPPNKISKSIQLSLSCTNVFTLTNYSGFDPEVSSFNQELLKQGIDFGSYPQQRTFTFGVSCVF